MRTSLGDTIPDKSIGSIFNMKSPPRLLQAQRRAGKKRLTQILWTVVAIFVVRRLSTANNPSNTSYR